MEIYILILLVLVIVILIGFIYLGQTSINSLKHENVKNSKNIEALQMALNDIARATSAYEDELDNDSINDDDDDINNQHIWKMGENNTEIIEEIEEQIQPQNEEQIQPENEEQTQPEVQPEVEEQIQLENEEQTQPQVQLENEQPIQPEVQTEIQPEIEEQIQPEIQPELELENKEPTQPEVQPENEEQTQPENEQKQEIRLEPELEIKLNNERSTVIIEDDNNEIKEVSRSLSNISSYSADKETEIEVDKDTKTVKFGKIQYNEVENNTVEPTLEDKKDETIVNEESKIIKLDSKTGNQKKIKPNTPKESVKKYNVGDQIEYEGSMWEVIKYKNVRKWKKINVDNIENE